MKIIAAMCPRCGKWVPCDKDEKFNSHDSSTCTGSHMEYGTCKGSGKKVPQPKAEDEYIPYDQA